jgi:hypothetical protein
MLRQDSPKKSWAHMKSSATSVEGSMDPLRCFGRTHRRNPGPMRNHRPLLWRDQWAHSDASAELTEEILSPYEIIGHFCEEISGPIQMLWQDSPKKFWAHAKSSATSMERSMGPLRCFGKTHEEILGPYEIIGHFYGEIHGPTQMLRQDSPKKFWAHTKSPATSVRRSVGPSRCFGKTHRRNSGPIRNYRPLL